MRILEITKPGIPRSKLPQIHIDDIKGKFKYKLGKISLDKMTPVQTERLEKESIDAKNKILSGTAKPIMLDKLGNIVNGHHRYDAYKELGHKKVPAVLVDATLSELMQTYSDTVEENVSFVKPQFDVEWGEATRYPFLYKLGQQGWEELAKTGKAITVTKNSVKKIGNTGADGSETLDDLEPDKVARLKKAMKSGTVEMPIVMKQPNGELELIGGNTRLIGLINTVGKATVWYIDASKLGSVAEEQDHKLSEAPRTLQSQVTPLGKLVQAYSYLTTFGMVHLNKDGATPEAQQQLLALVQRMNKDGKTFANLDKQKIEANRDTILSHIHSMMQYAIPVLKKNLPADKWEAKRGQINAVLTAYNNARQTNEASGYIT